MPGSANTSKYTRILGEKNYLRRRVTANREYEFCSLDGDWEGWLNVDSLMDYRADHGCAEVGRSTMLQWLNAGHDILRSVNQQFKSKLLSQTYPSTTKQNSRLLAYPAPPPHAKPSFGYAR